MTSIVRSLCNTKAWRFLLALVLATAVTGAACDDETLPDPGPSSGLDVDTKLIDLSDAEEAALCDWIAGRYGGYGKSVTCADGTKVSARQSRALCLMDFQTTQATCTLTIGDVEQCANSAVGEPRCQTVPEACSVAIDCN